MKKLVLKVKFFKLLAVLVILLFSVGKAYPQCGTGTANSTILPASTWQNTASVGLSQRPYWPFSAVAGKTYSFSNCNGTAEDTYMRIYNSSWTELANNDDYGPFGVSSQNASLVWTCPTTGTYYVFLTHYSCVALSNNQVLSYKVSSVVVPPSGSNSLTLTTCNEGISNIAAGEDGYYDNANGYTVVTPSSGQRVQLSGTYNTEVNYDYIYVYDGNGTGGALLGTFTGTGTLPCNLISSAANQPLTVRFTSDDNTYSTGIDFSAACVTPAGDQSTAGNGSWIGYVYAKQKDFSNTNYRGYITESEIFNRAFGTGAVTGATTNMLCAPTDDFTIRYKMTKTFTAGTYSFTVGGDDGVRFYIDGVLKINDWTDHTYTSFTYTTAVTAGSHTLMIEYYDNNNGAQVSFSSVTTSACTWTGNVSTNWSDRNNWNPNTIAPTNTMDVFIPNTSRKPISAVNYEVGAGRQLVVYSGATLTFDGKGLTNKGTLTVNSGGTLSLTTSTLGSGSFTNDGTVNCGGSMLLTLSLVNNGAFNCTGSLIIHDNFTNNATGVFTCSGSLTFDGGTTSGTMNSQFTNTGAFSCFDLIANKEATYSLMLSSDLYVENLTIGRNGFNTKYTTTSAVNVYVSGNWTNNGIFTHNNKKVTFNGTSVVNTGGTGAGKTFYDVDINGTSATLNINDIIISRNFNIINGLVNTSGKNMTVGGNWTNSGTFLHGNGTVTFNGSTNTLLNGNNISTFYNLISNKSAARKMTVSSRPLIVEKDFTISTGIFEIANTDTSSYSAISGNVLISTGANLFHNKQYSGAGHEALSVTGNWDCQGTYSYATSAMVTFNGSVNQEIKSGGSAFSCINFNNTTSGAADLNVSQPMNINTKAIFNNGIVSFSGTGSINFGNGAIAVGANDNSFVNGPVSKTGQDEFEFPTGDVVGADYVWAPIRMADPGTNATDKFTAEYFLQPAPNNWQPYDMCNVYDLDHVSGTEYWDITRNSGNTYPDLTLYWKKASRSGIIDVPNLVVGHVETCGWKRMPGSASGTTGTTGIGAVTATGFTGYSFITFGTKINSNPLPIELIDFKGKCNGDSKELIWTTATETNNDYFTLERSINGTDWSYLAKIKGAGNSNQNLSYSYSDKASGDDLYYRLKQTDFNGQSETFDPIVVNCSETNDKNISIFPNPFQSLINISLSDFGDQKITLNIYDMFGKLIENSDYSSSGGFDNNISLELGSLPSGVYFMEIIAADYVKSTKIVKSK
jgi:hypothetical protein